MTRPQDTTAWRTLGNIASQGISTNAERLAPAFPSPVSACGITLDLSRQRVPASAALVLANLATDINLAQKARALVAGDITNITEGRRVVHTLSRTPLDAPTSSKDARNTLTAMETFVNAVREGQQSARSLADRRYTDVMVIGIGGSTLGPQLAINALARFADGPRIHFLSNIDGAAFDDLTAALSPLTTLVVVISKTFTTEETTINAEAARVWLEASVGDGAFLHQFVAVTANPEGARRRGYAPAMTFAFDVGVGGRFSMWSAVGLPVALAVGVEHFRALLDGAHAMDQHFANAPFTENLPMLLAAVGVWNSTFEGIDAHAVLPYAQRLSLLPKHLQQLEMESNGKSVDLDGMSIDYPTCPVIFGEAGTNGQHSFHQLLHQGTVTISSDVLIVREREGRSVSQHQRLLSNAFAQANAFWDGSQAEDLPAHRVHHGRRPVTLIELERLDPFCLGALVVLYEHKVFVQGVMWHINSFDQWGVELGKTIAKNLLPEVVKAITNTPTNQPICRHFMTAAAHTETPK